MPFILQFTAVHNIGEIYNHLVMPIDENFTIEPEATKVNGWTKESFLKDTTSKKLSFPEVWSGFLEWLGHIGLNLDEDIYLCAYNGYGFDFRIIIHELRRFGIYNMHNFKLLDPWLDQMIFTKKAVKLDDAFKEI